VKWPSSLNTFVTNRNLELPPKQEKLPREQGYFTVIGEESLERGNGKNVFELLIEEGESCVINLIFCGGVGSRLWPVSRKLMPKQFFPLFGRKSLFEMTVERNQRLAESFQMASNKEQSFLAFEQLAGLGQSLEAGLIEPVGRNTAPAIALVCFNNWIQRNCFW
jgi:hypothetical protein